MGQLGRVGCVQRDAWLRSQRYRHRYGGLRQLQRRNTQAQSHVLCELFLGIMGRVGQLRGRDWVHGWHQPK
jgi:hypothetical protein